MASDIANTFTNHILVLWDFEGQALVVCLNPQAWDDKDLVKQFTLLGTLVHVPK
uniref:Uncharacterized protein n=1 Tax=viral metagenome TaxID=1070528 RepID=A0A6M3KV92_9ZZZZ